MTTEQLTPRQASHFVRSIYAGRDLEFFLVVAVATILILRAVLAATGWPQLGGGKIHFAHLVWGGLGMLIAFVLFMSMKGRLWQRLATVGAGIGFGLFLDELGKFITSDNDYFFQPAVAIIYLVFVVLFLVARAFVTTGNPSPPVALVNLIDLVAEGAARPWDESERAQALQLLRACDQDDSVVQDLRPVVTGMAAHTSGHPGPFERVKRRLDGTYERLVVKRWFKALVWCYLGLVALGGLLTGVAAVLVAKGIGQGVEASFWTYGQAVSASVSGALVVIGFVAWRRSRLAAYRWFLRALLVGIFVTQFFAFYNNQVSQVFSLFVLLLTYAAVRSMARREELRVTGDPAPA
jgi:hypothetical protein